MRRTICLVPVMLHPVYGLPILLASCSMQHSKYGFAYLQLRAFAASTTSTDSDAEQRVLLERVLPRVVAASPNCVSLHAELAQCVQRGLFLLRMQRHDCVIYCVRVPWMFMPTSLPRSCT